MSDEWKAFLVGMFIGSCGLGTILTFVPTHTRIYKECQLDMFKQAYAKGYAIREIDKDDKVIYKWK